MSNVTLVRRDLYLAQVKSSIKQETLAAVRQAPLDLPTLFPDSILRKAEEDISKFEDKGHTHSHCWLQRQSLSSLQKVDSTVSGSEGLQTSLKKPLGIPARKKAISPTIIHPDRPRVSRHLNDNYCGNGPVPR